MQAAPRLDPVTTNLVSLLANVPNATTHRYRATDDHGRTLDCLKILELAPGDYLGVYHTLQDREFQLHLGRSTNLLHWSHRAVLDQRSSQGAIWHGPRGDFLLAYEVNVPKAVIIRLRHYANLDAILNARFDREIDLPRTLAPTAEGTPSFERVELNGDLATSRIDLRIHYYRDMKVDRAARGTLLGFTNWTARPVPEIDEALYGYGVKGNIGDRDHFVFDGRKFLIQEGQLKPNDWTSWRVFLLDDTNRSAVQINVRTHAGSRSFANPAVTRLRDPAGKWCLAATLFLPSQGNARGEAGTLIYVVPEDR
ncbi:MAG: hypothetical protein IPK15_04080 [Verrucomicrobia bacterium]|nr:hypothetical protein [Verrucomicrobiota bacterium]